MTDGRDERLAQAELEELFDRLFPHGIAGPDVLAEIAPEGWHSSPLLACFHPSVEQLYREAVQVHRSVEALLARRGRSPEDPDTAPKPEPTFEEIHAEWKESPVDAAKEVTDLVGGCLWDLFSDNHEVIAADGRVANLGSFRASAGFIDAWIAGRSGLGVGGDYLHFYMGSIWIRGRANLIPVYQMIFRRLRALGADWRYHFPELYLVDLSGYGSDDEEPDEEEPKERRRRQREIDEFRAELAEANRRARQDARLAPPPEVVRAYAIVYGREPRGWPPA